MDDPLADLVPLLPEDDDELNELLTEPTGAVPLDPEIVLHTSAARPAVSAPITPVETPTAIELPVVEVSVPVAPAADVVTTMAEVVTPAAPVTPIIAASTAAPVTPDPAQHIENIQMGNLLTNAIEEGKHRVPDVPTPLISKPAQLESWRVFKIMAEFVDGFELISKYSKAATFFGSERHTFDERIYQDATALAGKLAKQGFAIITGGSDGIMEAANKGAFEAGGASIGLNIRLGDNQQTNKYVTSSMMFEHFFVRKVMLTYASEAYIYFPGGFGTLDEFTEILTLVQTKNIKSVPIILYGKEYWTPFLELFKKNLDEKYHAIDATDTELYHLVDTVDEACDYICANAKSR
jgi:uncharacterized protein (TIGR00730 family)